ncbi:MFS transporter [Amycolatopsis sp. NBC_00345]|uniref:MFS transporter n=1 Tax=Amycolatopsis sp. NBC_00345 TaxID=2975955 RepID=UPI002E25C6A1
MTLHPRRNPWSVVVGSGLAQSVGLGPLILSTFGLFVLPIAAETGWSRATVTVAFTVTGVGFAAGTPLAGWLLDRYALKVVMIPSWFVYCAAVALIGVTPRALPVFYLPFLLAGLAGGGTFLPFSKAVLSWFDNRRGLALGVMAALGALGATLSPLLVRTLIASLGWQASYGWMALIAVVVSVSMVLALVRVRAERSVRGRLVTTAVNEERAVRLDLPGLTVRQALAGRHLWMIGGILCLAGIAVIGIQVNVVPMMTDEGLPAAQAGLLLTVYGVASLAGRIVGGVLLDRVPARFVTAGVLLCPVAGIFLLRPSFPSAAAAIALVGVAFGVEIDLLSYLISRYLGMRRFGTLLGLIQCAVLLSTAFGPLLVSLGYQATGDYRSTLPYLGSALVLCALSALFLGPYRYPAVSGFDAAAAQDELAAAEKLAELAAQETGASPQSTQSVIRDPRHTA